MHALFSTDMDFFKDVNRIGGHAKSKISRIYGIKDNWQISDKFVKQYMWYKELFDSNLRILGQWWKVFVLILEQTTIVLVTAVLP